MLVCIGSVYRYAPAQERIAIRGSLNGIHTGREAAPYFRKGDRAVLRFSGTWSPPPTSMWLWIDSFNRVVARLCPENGKHRISFDTSAACARKNHIVLLDSKGNELDRVSFMVVPDRDPFDNYEVIVWNSSSIGSGLQEALRQMGISAAGIRNPAGGRTDPGLFAQVIHREAAHPFMSEASAKGGMRFASYIEARLSRPVTYRSLHPFIIRRPCFSDPAVIESWHNSIGRNISGSFSMRPLVYCFGDGIGLAGGTIPYDCCHSTFCLNKFREHLKKQYLVLKALNVQWGTSFESWNKVRPDTADEAKCRQNPHYIPLYTGTAKNPDRILKPDEQADPGKENFSAWCDHRSFMDGVWSGTLRRMTAYIRKSAPDGIGGAAGLSPPSAFSGADWWLQQDALDWIETVPGFDTAGLVRSWNPGCRTVVRDADEVSGTVRRMWESLLSGGDGIIIRKSSALFTGHTHAVSSRAASIRKHAVEFQRGLASLLMDIPVYEDPVGIYYSQKSVQVGFMLDTEMDGTEWIARVRSKKEGRGTYLSAVSGFAQAAGDIGLTPAYVSYAQAAEGMLNKMDLKVLILPKVFAMSYREAEQIRSFVINGGTVIADNACATFDGHGKRLNKGLLDGLFGIKRKNFRLTERNGTVRPSTSAPAVLQNEDHALLKGISSGGTFIVTEPGIECAEGTALVKAGSIPAVIINKTGRGFTCYLNISYGPYVHSHTSSAQVRPLSILLRNLCTQSGAAPRLSVSREKGEADSVRITEFRDGKLAYLGIRSCCGYASRRADSDHRSGGAPVKLNIGIPHKKYIYDQRQGTYLGHDRSFSVVFHPDEGACVSLLPYRVAGLKTEAVISDDRSIRYSVQIQTGGDSAGRHVLRRDVYGPDETYYSVYSRTVTVLKGRTEGGFHLAENDPGGVWRIVFTDAATGISGLAKIRKNDERFSKLYTASDRNTAPAVQAGWRAPCRYGISGRELTVTIPFELYSCTFAPAQGTVEFIPSQGWKAHPRRIFLDATPFKGEVKKNVVCHHTGKTFSNNLSVAARVTYNGPEKVKEFSSETYRADELKEKLIASAVRVLISDPVLKKITSRRQLAFTVHIDHTQDGLEQKGEISLKGPAGIDLTPSRISLGRLVSLNKSSLTVTATPRRPEGYRDLRITKTYSFGTSVSLTDHAYLKCGFVRPVLKSPVIDGETEEECWNRALQLGIFLDIHAEEPAAVQSRAGICRDEKNLYVSVVCLLPEEQNISMENESVEVLVASDGKTYFTFGAGALGAQYDARDGDTSCRPVWKYAVKKEKGLYRVEMAIPFSSVRKRPPSPGDVWRINIVRRRYPDQKGNSAWSCPHGVPEDISRFGYLFFTELPEDK